MTQTAELAAFLTGLQGRVSATRPAALTQARSALVDTLACMVHGSRLPWTQAAHRLVATEHGGADAHSTVIGSAGPPSDDAAANAAGTALAAADTLRVSVRGAALANGAAAHAFELDDVHEEAISHPGAVVVPAALALAEHLDATGSPQRGIDLLEAIVVGYEAMGRAGIAVGPAAHMLGGFHPTSMSGVFGAAAAAGRLLGFDRAQMTAALGVAATLASGTMEFAASGGMTKRLHAGRAAEGGVTAALMVAEGFDGPADGLAGTYGFCHVFSPEPQLHLLTEHLGGRWMFDEITVKPYAACSDLHPMMQAAEELRHDEQVPVDQIVRIEAEGPTKAATQNDMDGTTSVMAAQYSAQFNVAAALLADPADPATYSPTAIADPALADMQAKVVSLTAAPEFDATYAWKMGGRVRVTLSDGSVAERTVHGQRGSMHSPLAPAELMAKVHRVAGSTIGARVHDAVEAVPDSGPLTPLWARLAVMDTRSAGREGGTR
ncbi:MAG: MmgE/PrpD family protein [Actinomycetota bacterium]